MGDAIALGKARSGRGNGLVVAVAARQAVDVRGARWLAAGAGGGQI